MPRFIAIPVAQGDAFYLQRDDFSVLVDGGRSRSGFPAMFQAITQAGGVKVTICTHNDADHANRILGFLEAGFRCEEVWLPGRWRAALPDVLKPFVEVFVELVDNVAETNERLSTGKPQSGLSPIEIYAEHLREASDEDRPTNDGLSVGEDGWPESYLPILEQAEPWDVAPWVRLWPPEDWPFFPYRHYRRLGPSGVQLLWSAIDAATRIRAIAVEAFHRGLAVRSFQFDAAAPSGGVPALQPVNARAVARVHPRVGRLLDLLALTVTNKESLAFWSPPTQQHPGVLFTADSDLVGVRLPTQLVGALATAPHHGSEANANAYAALAAAAQQNSSSITWVRSDGRYRSRPGRTYLGLSSRRLCTLCRLGAGVLTPKQAVHLFSRGAVWTRHRATVTCSCQ
jgi:hypothetical protein